MKKISKIIFVAVLISSTLFTSCGKYEEGPKISFASKKGRLTRKWVLEKFIDGTTGTETSCSSACPRWNS
ncbi:MAG TPA: hypothetical protein VFL70_10155 [Bacteroidia bacterium]|nr:hypothetical protein [Bacteroidia bacterium]